MEKKYFYNNLIILVALIICICFYNYKLDPYGIWKTDFSEQVLEPNKIYLKTKYILENPNKYDEYLERFVDIQMEIHSKKAPLLNKLKDKMNRKISEADLDATTRYDLHTRLEGMPKHNKVCHGDFNPSNIIIKDDGTPFILDWSHATQGNASADVARTYLLFYLEGNIDGANKYLDLFCKKSDTAKQYIQKWLPIVAASQSVKGKPEEREFLLNWVNVVDYE